MSVEEYAAYWKRRREEENMTKKYVRQQNGARSYVKRPEVMIDKPVMRGPAAEVVFAGRDSISGDGTPERMHSGEGHA